MCKISTIVWIIAPQMYLTASLSSDYLCPVAQILFSWLSLRPSNSKSGFILLDPFVNVINIKQDPFAVFNVRQLASPYHLSYRIFRATKIESSFLNTVKSFDRFFSFECRHIATLSHFNCEECVLHARHTQAQDLSAPSTLRFGSATDSGHRIEIYK